MQQTVKDQIGEIEIINLLIHYQQKANLTTSESFQWVMNKGDS